MCATVTISAKTCGSYVVSNQQQPTSYSFLEQTTDTQVTLTRIAHHDYNVLSTILLARRHPPRSVHRRRRANSHQQALRACDLSALLESLRLAHLGQMQPRPTTDNHNPPQTKSTRMHSKSASVPRSRNMARSCGWRGKASQARSHRSVRGCHLARESWGESPATSPSSCVEPSDRASQRVPPQAPPPPAASRASAA